VISDYCIIKGDTADELSAGVAEHIRDGWQPFGSAQNVKGGTLYIQPMVRHVQPQPLEEAAIAEAIMHHLHIAKDGHPVRYRECLKLARAIERAAHGWKDGNA
jgi:hypothetical protein